MKKSYRHRTGIDASTTIIVEVVSLFGFAHAHGHDDMLHKWSRSIAASTTIAAAASMPSGHVTHLTTWREVALYGVNTKDAAGLRRHCTWCARTRIAVYSVTSPVDVGHSSKEQLARLPYSACGPRLNSQTPERWLYRPTRVTRGPHRQRQACPKL